MKYLVSVLLLATLAFGVTMGEANALARALDYLDYRGFSYEGLVGQLEYEGFSHSEAVYAADNCEADWNLQAVRRAESYLDFRSFSRQGLIDQLEYEGFTRSQAEYGAAAVGYGSSSVGTSIPVASGDIKAEPFTTAYVYSTSKLRGDGAFKPEPFTTTYIYDSDKYQPR